MRHGWWLTLLCFGCTTKAEDGRLPARFVYGTAIAGFQTEMGCPTLAAAECEDRHSDWYDFITDPTLVSAPNLFISGDAPSTGPGFYELYEQDLDRAAHDLHNNSLRISIEWSRLFPTATDGIDGHEALRAIASPQALAYYHSLLAAMKARGLAPMVTLNHYTLPSWLHDAHGCHLDLDHCSNRGWVDGDRIIPEISKYARFVATEFGADIDLYATLNEPLTAVVLVGYLFQTEARTNPPAVFFRTQEAKAAYRNMIVAHARMYDAVKSADTVDADGDGVAARIGIVYNLQSVAPEWPGDAQDERGAANMSYIMNQMFLDGVAKGDFDAEMDGHPVHRDDLAGRMDFLGVNYYARTIASGTPSSLFPEVSPLLTFNLISLTYDYDYPKGIYDVLMFARQYGVPMIVTETGVSEADSEPGKIASWIVRTMTWVKRAIADGANVEGYYTWSLMDNYEWNHGMSFNMGLYKVDKSDPLKTRTARSGVGVYGRIAAGGEIPADLMAQYPVEKLR
jgi:beta-galactosidase